MTKWKTIRVKIDSYEKLQQISEEMKGTPIWKIVEFMLFSKAQKFMPNGQPVAVIDEDVVSRPVLAKSGLQRVRPKDREEARKEGFRRRHNLSLLEKLGRRDYLNI